MKIKLTKLDKNDDRKYRVVFTRGGQNYNIKFGANGYGDYIIYNEKEGKEFADERRRLYLIRNVAYKTADDITTAGFWARWLLWNKSTLKDSINDIERRFGVKIDY